jgi:topoisomerase-4 subunit B
VTEALREFCELRNLLPRNLKLSAEDVWDGVNYILSLKFQEPQFSGQTKERLSSREASNIVLNIAKDAFACGSTKMLKLPCNLLKWQFLKQVVV